MSTDFQIKTEAQLTEVLGEAHEFILEKVLPALTPLMIEFIGRSPLIMLSTLDGEGRIDTSPKGDAPGFVQVDDQGNLLIPDRPGNKMALGFRNIVNNPEVGLIFVVPHQRETLRVKGTATLSNDPVLLEKLSAQGKPALLCTQLQVSECFFHCGKAMIRSKMWKPEHWVEHGDNLMQRQMAEGMKLDEALVEEGLEASYRDELY
jgi:uncharacterized protein